MKTTKARGYGAGHIAQRKREERRVKSGEAYCAKCGR
jgi:hypothetical protein